MVEVPFREAEGTLLWIVTRRGQTLQTLFGRFRDIDAPKAIYLKEACKKLAYLQATADLRLVFVVVFILEAWVLI